MTTEPRPYQTDNNDEAFTALLDEYGKVAQHVAQIRALYFDSKNVLGLDHPATKILWDEYLDADNKMQPLSIKIGQMSMRRQIDSMSTSEFESFRRNND